jgi:choline dehydrogenase-like flavoprotein
VSSGSEAFDVIVIGFGYAGAIAAIEAHDAGASVLILEKQTDPGGISVCSAGGLRIAKSAADAYAYLAATNAGTAPEPVLRRLAEIMSRTTRCPAATRSALSISKRCRASTRRANFPWSAARLKAHGCSRWCSRRCGAATA